MDRDSQGQVNDLKSAHHLENVLSMYVIFQESANPHPTMKLSSLKNPAQTKSTSCRYLAVASSSIQLLKHFLNLLATDHYIRILLNKVPRYMGQKHKKILSKIAHPHQARCYLRNRPFYPSMFHFCLKIKGKYKNVTLEGS